MKRSLEGRFWAKVGVAGDDDCWEWKSAFTTRNYGFFWVGGEKRSEYAHRVSYTLAKGEIPEGMVVMHSCDNTRCVNPKHLSVGTFKDNSQDSIKKKRAACTKQHGSNNPYAKVSELTVQRLRIVGNALTQSRLTQLTGTTRENVGQILRLQTWAHVTSNKQALA